MTKHITGTAISYLHYCKRRLWLYERAIDLTTSSDLVTDGRLTHEYSYKQRSSKYEEISFDGIKIDFFDRKENVVHETKRSNSHNYSDVAQLQYYLFVLEQNGFINTTGVLEYPKLRLKKEVFLTNELRARIPEWEEEVKAIRESDEAPGLASKHKCKNCAYLDFCYA